MVAQAELGIVLSLKDQASAALAGVQGKLQGFGKSAVVTGAKLTAGVSLPLALIGKKVVTTATDFESQMKILEVAAGDAGVGIEDLRKAALDVGADVELVGISASEAADAMTGFYKAGLTTADIFGDLEGYLEGGESLTGALRAAVDLAAASDLDLAAASDLVAVAMSTFGLGADEATSIADSFVKSADASVAEVEDLAAALVNVGPTAASFGWSLEDTNAALAILSTRGIKGAEAGTALKSMMTHLMNPTKGVTEALSALNVDLYNADGTMKELPTIIGALSGALGEGAKMSVYMGGASAELTEKAMKAKSALTGLEQKLVTYEAKSGLAADAMRTLKDEWVETHGTLEGFGRTLGDQNRYQLFKAVKAYDEARSTIQRFEEDSASATTAVKALTEQQRNEYVQTLAGTYGMKAMNTLLDEGIPGWKAMEEGVANAASAQDIGKKRTEGLAGALEQMSGTIDYFMINVGTPLITDFLTPAVLRITDLASKLSDSHPGWEKWALVIGGVLIAAGPVVTIIGALGAAIGLLLSPIGLAITAIGLLAAAFAKDFLGIRTKVTKWWEAIRPKFELARAWLAEKIPEAIDTVKETLSAIMAAPWDFPWEDIFPDWLADAMYKVSDALWDLKTKVGTVIGWLKGTAVPYLQEAIKSIVDAFRLEGLKGGFAEFINQWETLKEKVTPAIESFLAALPGKLDEIVTTVRDWVTTNAPIVGQKIKELFSQAISLYIDWLGLIVDLKLKIFEFVGGALDKLTEKIPEWTNLLVTKIKELLEGGTGEITKPEWINEVGGLFKKLISGAIEFLVQHVAPLGLALWDAAKQILGVFIDYVGANWQSWANAVGGYIKDLWEGAVAWLEKNIGPIIESAKQAILDWWEGLKAYVSENWRAWADAAGDFLKQLWAAAVAWISDNIGPIIEQAKTAILEWKDKVVAYVSANWKAWADAAGTFLKDLWAAAVNWISDNIGPIIKDAKDAIGDWWDGTVKYVKDNWKGWADKAGAFLKDLWDTAVQWIGDNVGPAVTKAKDAIVDWKDQAVSYVSTNWKTWADTLGGKIQSLWTSAVGWIEKDVVPAVNKAAGAIKTWASDLASHVSQNSGAWADDIGAKLQAMLTAAVKWISENLGPLVQQGIQALKDWFADLTADAEKNGETWGANFGTILADVLSAVIGGAIWLLFKGIPDFIKMLIGFLGNLFVRTGTEGQKTENKSVWGGILKTMFTAAWNAFIAQMKANLGPYLAQLVAWVKSVFDGLPTASDLITALKNAGRKLIETMIEGFEDAKDALIEKLTSIIGEAVDKALGPIKDIIAKLQSILGGIKLPKLPFGLGDGGEEDLGEALLDAMGLGAGTVDAIVAGVQDFLKILRKLFADMPEDVSEKIKNYASLLSNVAGAIERAVEAMLAVGGMEKVPAFAKRLERLMDYIALVLDKFKKQAGRYKADALEKIRPFTEAIGAIAGIIASAVAAFQAIGDLGPVKAFTQRMKRFADYLDLAMKSLVKIAEKFGETGLAKAKVFAESAGAVLGIFDTGVAAFSAIGDLTPVRAFYQRMRRFAEYTEKALAYLIKVAKKFGTEGLAKAKEFADAASAVLAIIADGVAALTALGEFVRIEGLAQKAADFAANLDVFMGKLVKVAKDFGTKGLEKAKEFADAVGAVVAVIGPALEGLGLLMTAIVPTTDEIAANLERFASNMYDIVAAFWRVALGFTIPMLTLTKEFGDTVGAIVGVVGDAIEAMKVFVDNAIPTSDQIAAGLERFAENMYEIVKAFGQKALGFTIPTLALIKEFADTAGAIMGLISDALEGIKNLLEYESTLHLPELAAALARDIYLVIRAFNDAVAEFATTGYDAAMEFAEAAEAVMGALGTALGTFGMFFEQVETGEETATGEKITKRFADLLIGSFELMKEAADKAFEVMDHIVGLLPGYVAKWTTELAGFADVREEFASSFSALGTALDVISKLAGYSALAREKVEQFISDVEFVLERIVEAVDAMFSVGTRAGLAFTLHDIWRRGFDMTSTWLLGMLSGISTMAGPVVQAIRELVNDMIAAAETGLGVASPSEMFGELGGASVEGLIQGILNRARAAAQAMMDLIDLISGGRPYYEAGRDSALEWLRGWADQIREAAIFPIVPNMTGAPVPAMMGEQAPPGTAGAFRGGGVTFIFENNLFVSEGAEDFLAQLKELVDEGLGFESNLLSRVTA